MVAGTAAAELDARRRCPAAAPCLIKKPLKRHLDSGPPPPSPLYLPCRAPVLRRRVRIREEMEEDMALQTTGCKALPGPLPAPYRRTHGKPMEGRGHVSRQRCAIEFRLSAIHPSAACDPRVKSLLTSNTIETKRFLEE